MTEWQQIFEGLDRRTLVRAAYEYMLSGMLVSRATLAQIPLAGRPMSEMDEVAIDEWMGASPIYTARTRALMGIEGDNVEAIMKALQLDVGFVHEYMDVAYRVIDDSHGEFWLNHCGALLDAEPHGEERVFGMCHTIEDPTFDATAYATNPRARIRPIHRPPRSPSDRHPHCHWTIEIDPDNDPVGPARLTAAVGALALAAVPNRAGPLLGDGRADYRSPLKPDFRLGDLDTGTLAAVAREFQMQSHLLLCSWHLAIAPVFAESAQEMVAQAWVGAGWVLTERLAAALGATSDVSGLVQVLALHPMIPPGFDREFAASDRKVVMTLRATDPGLMSDSHPGLPGTLARGDSRGLQAMVHPLVPTAEVDLRVEGDTATVTVEAVSDRSPARLPDMAAIVQIGLPAAWKFSVA